MLRTGFRWLRQGIAARIAGRCETCKWWEPGEAPGKGLCVLTTRTPTEEPEHPESLAICDGYCGLITSEGFGCIQWEPKE